jgi:hypothetical protein
LVFAADVGPDGGIGVGPERVSGRVRAGRMGSGRSSMARDEAVTDGAGVPMVWSESDNNA